MRFIIILFILASCKNNSNNEFQLCSNTLTPFYKVVLSSNIDFYQLNNTFQDNLKEIDNKNFSGIIKVRFDVNCKTTIGNFDVQCFNFKYKKIDCNEIYSKKIISTIQTFKYDIPVDYDGNIVDCRKFYSFKIIDGILKDIMPK